MQIKVLTEGGSIKPGPALSQKVGPAGINMGQVISKINEATKSFAGLKVPVELDIDTAAKTFSVKVFSPPVSELLKKELKIDKGSNAQKKIRVANASIEQIISVAKTKMPNMLSKNLKSAVKSVVGTCISLGTLIENKSAKEIIEDINAGIYDEEIQAEKTETSSDKRKKLDQYFSEVKAEQEKILQQEQAAKEAAEAAAAVKPEEGAEAKKEEVPKEEKKEKEPSKK